MITIIIGFLFGCVFVMAIIAYAHSQGSKSDRVTESQTESLTEDEDIMQLEHCQTWIDGR